MCDICGYGHKSCRVIGMFPQDMLAWRRNWIECPVCESMGQYALPHFRNPRPCPICKGVGCLNKDLMQKSPEVIADMLMTVFPPRVAPCRPVPQGEISED